MDQAEVIMSPERVFELYGERGGEDTRYKVGFVARERTVSTTITNKSKKMGGGTRKRTSHRCLFAASFATIWPTSSAIIVSPAACNCSSWACNAGRLSSCNARRENSSYLERKRRKRNFNMGMKERDIKRGGGGDNCQRKANILANRHALNDARKWFRALL